MKDVHTMPVADNDFWSQLSDCEYLH